MSKIALQVGTRATSSKAPVAYEIPREVVAEGIVNAVAHRDYASNGSVQVMLFADRLEVWNPGCLPSSLTVEGLRKPHGSAPHNPLLAEPLYQTQYIERMGTGTGDMIRRCREAGLPEPEFRVTDGFTATIWRRANTKSSGKSSGKTANQIINMIRKQPDITIPELAQHLGITERGVEKQMRQLKGDEVIGRLGPAKGGHWVVLK